MPQLLAGVFLPLKGNGATVTVSTPLLNLTQTWNAGGVAFTGAVLNVTDTASTGGSLLLDLQVGGVSKLNVTKFGAVTAVGGLVTGSGTGVGVGNSAFLFADAANTLALRNGVSAQAFNVYNTFTDAANYERGVFDWTTNANALTIGTTMAGTGAARNLFLRTGGTDRWTVNTNGHLLGVTDLLFDIGQPSANRVRGVYAGFTATSISSQSGTTYTVGTSDSSLIFTAATTVTVTLPAAASFTGRTIRVKTTGGGSVISASSNVVPKAGGAAGTAILAATAGTWAELQSDGAVWQMMAGT